MKTLVRVGVALGACLAAAPALAASSGQPPMDNFNNAFYTCDNNGAFLISYDSNKPQTATMTTSDNQTRYMLKRVPVAMGVQFSAGAVTFPDQLGVAGGGNLLSR